jgi:phosphoribosylformylglycinamidine (FGAM) synthase PurS component
MSSTNFSDNSTIAKHLEAIRERIHILETFGSAEVNVDDYIKETLSRRNEEIKDFYAQKLCRCLLALSKLRDAKTLSIS